MTNAAVLLQQTFLQACFARQLLTDTDATDLYVRACSAVELEPSDLNDFVADLNRTIFNYDMEFRKASSEDTGEWCWALVNTNGDKIAQYATGYTAQELQYFKRLMDMMVRSEGGPEAYSVSSIHALNESPREMSRIGTETLLGRFVDDGWLVLDSNGLYSFGIRCLLELQTQLREEYDQLKECSICKDLITKGERCDQTECPARLHYHCARRYFRDGARHQCPSCRESWSHDTHIGPHAAGHRPGPGSQSGSNSQSRRSTLTRSQGNHVSIAEQIKREPTVESPSAVTPKLEAAYTMTLEREAEEEEEEEEEVSTPRPKRRRSLRYSDRV